MPTPRDRAISLLLCLGLSLGTVSPSIAAPCPPQNLGCSSKKGIGLPEKRLAKTAPTLNQAQLLEDLKVDWYYNWGTHSTVNTPVRFVPMAFGLAAIDKLPDNSPVVLGFNEPDNPKQSNLTVEDALSHWKRLARQAQIVVSPASAHNPLREGSWLGQFVAAEPGIDAVAFHWYKGVNATTFKADIETLCQRFHKPVWVTEFAAQTVSSAAARPAKYNEAEVAAFIHNVVPWMNHNNCVVGYAWHDAQQGSSALWDASGNLSPTGIAYRDAE